MTFEPGLKHEGEPAEGSIGINVLKGPRAVRDLAGGVSKERRMW